MIRLAVTSRIIYKRSGEIDFWLEGEMLVEDFFERLQNIGHNLHGGIDWG